MSPRMRILKKVLPLQEFNESVSMFVPIGAKVLDTFDTKIKGYYYHYYYCYYVIAIEN